MHRAIPLLLVVSALAALTCRQGAADTCPSSTIWLYHDAVVGPAAAADTSYQGRHAAYNLLTGTVEISHPGDLGSMYCEPSDRYRVVGVADGTPIHLTAQLEVDGYSESNYSSGEGEFGAWIGQGNAVSADSVRAWSFMGQVPLRKTLEYSLDVLAGDWFDIHYRLWFSRSPGGAQFGGGTARLRFGGMPTGADVVSCQGYQLTTSAHKMSWGRVKEIYR